MAAVGTLNDAALQRKERLRAMREKRSAGGENTATESVEGAENDTKEKLPKPVFRSYKPETEELKDQTLPAAKPSDVKESVKDELAAGETNHVVTEVDLNKLAPRKPDWDLKRDVSKKLEKLEKRTQRAIAELIRERLKESQSDLASMVNVGESAYRAEAGDED